MNPKASPQRALTRRRILQGAVGALAAPMLSLVPRSSFADTLRPDQVDGTFWSAPRRIFVNNLNTGRRGEYLFWADGEYVMDGYLALSALLLDHREHAAVQLQPNLFNLMYASQRWYEGAERKRTETDVTSGFRTPRTNRLVGGAIGGRHPEAAALDGRLRGVSLSTYARMLIAYGAGGVGLYNGHVHWDVGRRPAFWRGQGAES